VPYIIDADWVINAIVGQVEVITTINRLGTPNINISVATLGEVYEGAFNSSNPQERLRNYRRFLSLFRVVSINDPIMERFAEIRAHLRRTGQIISDFDIILGATALHHGLTVLTFNRRHLERIPDLQVYET
jgi:tRNA(fMet)-specific endonuclease VapC